MKYFSLGVFMYFKVDDNKIYIDKGTVILFEDILDSIGANENDIVYIAGSLVEGYVNQYSKGMGNPNSDVDVFIIREHSDFKNTQGEYIDDVRKTFFCNLSGFRLDIEVFDASYVLALSKALSELEIDKHTRVLNLLKENLDVGNDYIFVNSFLNRLLYSICIFNQNQYEIVKSNLHYLNFFELKKNVIMNIIDNTCDDVKGNLLVKNADVSLFVFREMLRYVIELILTKEGILVDRDKWIFLKFHNLVKDNGRYNEFYNICNDIFRKDLSEDKYCLEKIKRYYDFTIKEIEMLLFDDLEI